MIFDTFLATFLPSLECILVSRHKDRALRSPAHLPLQFTPLSRNVNDARVRRNNASEFIAAHRGAPSYPSRRRGTDVGEEMGKFAKRSLLRPARRRCPSIRRYPTGIEASRVAGIESARAGWSGPKNAGFNRAVSRHRIFVVVVSRASRHRRDRAHRAGRSPFLDWHARSRNASEPATSVSSNKGNGDSSGKEGEKERGDRRENKERERIECAPAKAVAVGDEERGREGS